MNSLKSKITEVRCEPEILSTGDHTILEIYSFYDKNGDYVENDFTYEEVYEDIKERYGVPENLMKEVRNLDILQIRNDCDGVWLTYYKSDSLLSDKVWCELMKYIF